MDDSIEQQPTPAGAIDSRKKFERFLHEHGWSRSQAAGIAAKGWKAIREESVESDDADETLALLRRIEEAVSRKTEA